MTNFIHRLFTVVILFTTTTAFAQKNIHLLVGTYCNTPGKGISLYQFNQETGEAKLQQEMEALNPSFLTIDTSNNMMYAVSEVDNSKAAVYTVKLDPTSGQMKMKNKQLTKSFGPCHVVTNGKLLLTSNYTGGTLSVFHIGKKGKLNPLSQLFRGTTAPSDLPNQSQPHIHCTQFSPDGKYILASNFSANQLLRYNIGSNGTLHPAGVAARMLRNSGPRHFLFHNNKVYVINELSGTVCVFQESEGEMPLLQEIASDSVGGKGSADIHISPDGRFLYTSNRLKADGISIFSVHHQTGLLTKVGYQLTGIHPRNFNITPNGKFMLVACRDSHKIQVYRINTQTGLLTDTHQDIPLENPVCVQFYTHD